MGNSILLIGNHLRSANQNSTIIEDLAIRFKENEWEIITSSSKINKLLRLFDIIYTIFSKKKLYKIALVDVYSGPAFIWALISGYILNFLQKPFVIVLHGGNLPSFSKKHGMLIKSLMNKATMVISPSRYLQNYFSTMNPKILVISNPIEINKYEFNLRVNPKPYLVWLRAFHEIYNPLLVPDILRILKATFPDLIIKMVGPDKGDGSLQRMIIKAKELGISEMIDITGSVTKDKVPVILTQGDIFLNTTNIDNTPVSVIEAMASGLCIVSTNVGGIPYLLEHEVDALLAPPDDPVAMAAAIQRILNEPDLATRLSSNARKKAESFDWSIILPQWEALFEEVMNTNKN